MQLTKDNVNRKNDLTGTITANLDTEKQYVKRAQNNKRNPIQKYSLLPYLPQNYHRY